MGSAIPMQRWITLCGAANSAVPVIQSQSGWLDGMNFKDAAIDVLILRNNAGTAQQILYLETAIAPEGPWTVIATYNTGGYQHDIKYFTTTNGATNSFERFIRWRLDISASAPALAAWETCFRICAVVK